MLLQIGNQALYKRRIPFRSAVLQDTLTVVQQHLTGDLGALPIGKGFGRRTSARKRDHVGSRQYLEDFPNGTAGHMIEPGRKLQSLWQHDSHSPLNRRLITEISTETKTRLPPTWEEGEINRGTTSVCSLTTAHRYRFTL